MANLTIRGNLKRFRDAKYHNMISQNYLEIIGT